MQGKSPLSIEVRNPTFLAALEFTIMHLMQLSTIRSTLSLSLGMKYDLSIISCVFLAEKCPGLCAL